MYPFEEKKTKQNLWRVGGEVFQCRAGNMWCLKWYHAANQNTPFGRGVLRSIQCGACHIGCMSPFRLGVEYHIGMRHGTCSAPKIYKWREDGTWVLLITCGAFSKLKYCNNLHTQFKDACVNKKNSRNKFQSTFKKLL